MHAQGTHVSSHYSATADYAPLSKQGKRERARTVKQLCQQQLTEIIQTRTRAHTLPLREPQVPMRTTSIGAEDTASVSRSMRSMLANPMRCVTMLTAVPL